MACLPLIHACTPKPKAPQMKSGALAVAKIGSDLISDQDLMSRVEAIEKSFPRTYSTHPQKLQLLKEMINLELLYREAMKLGLDKKYEFKSRLADLYIQQIAENARANISDAEVEKEFSKNSDMYQQVSARHILLRLEKKDPGERAALRRKIESIRQEAIKDPTRFPDLAKNHSQDGSASTGGELGFFTRAMMVPPFSNAAFSLKKVGDISEVIETQFGFHIIQLTGDRRSMEFHKDLIKDRMVRQSQKDRLNAEIERLRRSMPIEIFEDNLAKLSPLPKPVEAKPEDLVPETPKDGVGE